MIRRTFNDLYAFTVVARHRSFTKAAQMDMSQSALSPEFAVSGHI